MKETKLMKIRKLINLCMRSNKYLLILPVIFTSIGSMLGALNPFIIGLAITELSANVKDMMAGVPGAGVNQRYILMIVVIMTIFNLLRQSLTYFSSYLLAGGVQNSFKDLRTQISQKMNRLPVSYFDSHQQGEVLNTVTNDVDTVSNAIQQSLLSMVYSLTSIITTFAMMLYISLPLGLLSMLMIPVSIWISSRIMKRSQSAFLSMQNTLAELNGYIQERYTGF